MMDVLNIGDLLVAVDSFTGILLAIRFEAQETTKGYYYLSNDLFKKYGLPRQIKTDRRTTFWNDDSSNSPLPKCFRELGIGLSSSTEPTFKPNVERMFQTMQVILPIYCLQNQIKNLEELRKHSEAIVNYYNDYCEKKIPKTSEFEKKNSDFIEKSLVYQREAKVLHGNNVSFQGKRSAPFNQNGQRILMRENGYVTIRQKFWDNKPYILIGSTKCYLQKISDQNNYSYKVNEVLKNDLNLVNNFKYQKDLNRLRKENESLKELIRKNNLKIISQI